VDQPGSVSASDRVREAVIDALRRVGPPETTLERALSVSSTDDGGSGQGT
jgi:hypothetical protein